MLKAKNYTSAKESYVLASEVFLELIKVSNETNATMLKIKIKSLFEKVLPKQVTDRLKHAINMLAQKARCQKAKILAVKKR